MVAEITELRKRLEKTETLFNFCAQSVKDPGGVDCAPLALFRQIMQMADGILILADAESSGPMFPLLRVMLDCYFSLEFVVGTQQGDSDEWRERSLAWLVFCINKEMELKESVDSSTQRGKTFKSELKAHDRGAGRRGFTHIKPIEDPIYSARPLRERLAESDLVAMQQEYLKSKPDYFFQLIDPKLRVENLARQTKNWDLYKIFYRPFSAAVHGTDLQRILKEEADGTISFGAVRVSESSALWVGLADSVLYLSAVVLAKHYALVFANGETVQGL